MNYQQLLNLSDKEFYDIKVNLSKSQEQSFLILTSIFSQLAEPPFWSVPQILLPGGSIDIKNRVWEILASFVQKVAEPLILNLRPKKISQIRYNLAKLQEKLENIIAQGSLAPLKINAILENPKSDSECFVKNHFRMDIFQNLEINYKDFLKNTTLLTEKLNSGLQSIIHCFDLVIEIIQIRVDLDKKVEETRQLISTQGHHKLEESFQNKLETLIYDISKYIIIFNNKQDGLYKRRAWLNFRVPGGESNTLTMEPNETLEENDKNLQHLRPLENTTFFNSIKGFALKPLKMQENTQPLKVLYMNSPTTIKSIEQHLQNLTSPPLRPLETSINMEQIELQKKLL